MGAATGPGAARPAPADLFVYALVLLVVAAARALRALARLAGLSAAAAEQPPPAPSRLPQHIALAGALQSPEHVARIARLARNAGAQVVTAHVCGCSTVATTAGRELGARSGAFDADTAADVGAAEGCASAHPVAAETKTHAVAETHKHDLDDHARTDALVTGTGGTGGAATLVAAARWLASTPLEERGVDVADTYAVVNWLDRDRCQVMLPSEPDVLLVFVGRDGLRTIHGFPPWQLRLTQICFVNESITSFRQTDLLRVVCAAAAAPKRFGT